MASTSLSVVENYLRDGVPGGTVLQDYEGPEPALLKGETVVEAVDRHRKRARELKGALDAIRHAPLPSNYVKERARAEIEKLAARGAIAVSADGKIAFPETRLRSDVHNIDRPGVVAFAQVIDVAALVAHLLKPAVLAAVDATVAAQADDRAALSPADRERREAAALSELLRVERDLSALVWRGQAEGLQVEHGEVSPLASMLTTSFNRDNAADDEIMPQWRSEHQNAPPGSSTNVVLTASISVGGEFQCVRIMPCEH